MTDASEQQLKVRRRWWMQPVCWIKRGHLHLGQPMTLVKTTYHPAGNKTTEVVVEQACARCGKSRYTVGVDCA